MSTDLEDRLRQRMEQATAEIQVPRATVSGGSESGRG